MIKIKDKEKEAYYFSHDSNARHDPNICEMRSLYGMEGYGRYWVLVEMLREQKDYKIKVCKWNAFALQMQCTTDAAQSFITDCIEKFELLKTDGEYFWSESLIRRMDKKEEKSINARKAAAIRWNKKGNTKVMQTHSDSNALKESKVKIYTTTAIEKYQNEISPTSSATLFKNIQSELEFFNDDTICYAIEKAVLAEVRNWNYIQSILNSWRQKGIKTYEQAKAEQRPLNTKEDKPSKPETVKNKFINFTQSKEDFNELMEPVREANLRKAREFEAELEAKGLTFEDYVKQERDRNNDLKGGDNE